MESVKSLNVLTLSQAKKNKQLQDFALEQERLGVPTISVSLFDELVKIAVKTPQQQDQTSSSHVRDDLNEK